LEGREEKRSRMDIMESMEEKKLHTIEEEIVQKNHKKRKKVTRKRIRQRKEPHQLT
jgi:hypothetical protein